MSQLESAIRAYSVLTESGIIKSLVSNKIPEISITQLNFEALKKSINFYNMLSNIIFIYKLRYDNKTKETNR